LYLYFYRHLNLFKDYPILYHYVYVRYSNVHACPLHVIGPTLYVNIKLWSSSQTLPRRNIPCTHKKCILLIDMPIASYTDDDYTFIKLVFHRTIFFSFLAPENPYMLKFCLSYEPKQATGPPFQHLSCTSMRSLQDQIQGKN